MYIYMYIYFEMVLTLAALNDSSVQNKGFLAVTLSFEFPSIQLVSFLFPSWFLCCVLPCSCALVLLLSCTIFLEVV